jgi:methyltransferase (TIGR00027 family)
MMPSASQSDLSAVHRTALSAAALRAAHSLRGAEPKIFRDELALLLTGMTEDEVIALATRVPAASASTCILRSRFTEDRLAAARERLGQYVILGAGLDSYALRMGDQLGQLIVFEVDDPIFQMWKRRRIEAIGLTLPQQLRFVPCDFESGSLPEALARSGFTQTEPCFISWLGVTQYLTREAVSDTLRWAAARPAGSEIVLTFLETNPQAESLKSSMAANGIDVVSHFTPAEMTAMLQEAGFASIEHLTSVEANERYFRHRSDGLRAPDIQRLVRASTR